jgi:two-component system, NtrC family, sensor kinase
MSTDRLSALEAELEVRTREIAEQQHFMATVIDSLPVGLYVVDREYRVQAWNHTRETGLQGIARGEALGRTIFEILHRQSAESLRQEFDEVFQSGELRQLETDSAASGAPRTYRISKIPMRIPPTVRTVPVGVTHVIAVGEDVTEWKEAEVRAAHAEKLAAIGQLAAGVMHEINNPLATISACAESMAGQLEERGAQADPKHAEYLRVIQGEVQRCKAIVDGLLDFSRARPNDVAPVDMVAVIEQALSLLQHHARFKRLVIRREFADGPDWAAARAVRGNAERLVQVMIALLMNASDAMGEKGMVTVRVHSDETWVVTEVIDDGAGISRSDVRKIFEPFYTTKPQGCGTGLGLSICHGIVADHGGRVDVDSAVGIGTTLRVSLPRHGGVA